MNLNLLWGLLRTEKPYAKIGYFLCLWWNYSKKGFSISVTFFAHVMHLSRVLLQHLAKPQRELAVTWCHFPSNSSYSNDISSSSLMKHSPCGLYPAPFFMVERPGFLNWIALTLILQALALCFSTYLLALAQTYSSGAGSPRTTP